MSSRVQELVWVRRRFAGRPDQVAAVRDQGSAKQPRRRAHETEALTGRGLELMDALAARWGASGGPEGYIVWFELEVA